MTAHTPRQSDFPLLPALAAVGTVAAACGVLVWVGLQLLGQTEPQVTHAVIAVTLVVGLTTMLSLVPIRHLAPATLRGVGTWHFVGMVIRMALCAAAAIIMIRLAQWPAMATLATLLLVYVPTALTDAIVVGRFARPMKAQITGLVPVANGDSGA